MSSHHAPTVCSHSCRTPNVYTSSVLSTIYLNWKAIGEILLKTLGTPDITFNTFTQGVTENWATVTKSSYAWDSVHGRHTPVYQHLKAISEILLKISWTQGAMQYFQMLCLAVTLKIEPGFAKSSYIRDMSMITRYPNLQGIGEIHLELLWTQSVKCNTFTHLVQLWPWNLSQGHQKWKHPRFCSWS